MKKLDNKYVYAGITAFCVMVAVFLCGFVFINFDMVCGALGKLNSAMMPIYIGLVIAYLLSPMVNGMERMIFIPILRKINKTDKRVRSVARGISIVLVLVLALAVIFWLTMLVVPEVVDSISNLANNLPAYYRNMIRVANDVGKKHPEIAQYMKESTDTVYAQVRNWVQNDLLPASTEILSILSDGLLSALGMLLNVVIGIIVSIYLMAGKEHFCAQGKRLLYSIFSDKISNRILTFGKDINWSFAKFFSGKIIDSIIVAIITFIALSVADIPYTALISVLVGVTNIIPFFGPYIGAIPSALLVFLASPIKGVIFLVLIIIIQQVDGNIIGPKIIGESVGLGSFWILFSILVFGALFGLIGMICAVPGFSVLYKTIKRWSHRRLEKKGLPPETKYYYRKNKGHK
ncbi:MAG: AI-2E family transporter [Eubacterium sp.]